MNKLIILSIISLLFCAGASARKGTPRLSDYLKNPSFSSICRDRGGTPEVSRGLSGKAEPTLYCRCNVGYFSIGVYKCDENKKLIRDPR